MYIHTYIYIYIHIYIYICNVSMIIHVYLIIFNYIYKHFILYVQKPMYAAFFPRSMFCLLHVTFEASKMVYTVLVLDPRNIPKHLNLRARHKCMVGLEDLSKKCVAGGYREIMFFFWDLWIFSVVLRRSGEFRLRLEISVLLDSIFHFSEVPSSSPAASEGSRVSHDARLVITTCSC